MSLQTHARANGRRPVVVPPSAPEIPVKLRFRRVLTSKPLVLGDYGWTGDTARLAVVYDLGRVMSLPEQYEDLLAEERAQIAAVQAQTQRVQAELRAAWGDYEARSAAATHGDEGARVLDLARALQTPGASAAEILSVARDVLEAAPAGAPPDADEEAAYLAAMQEAAALQTPLLEQLTTATVSITRKIIAWVVVEFGVLEAVPGTRFTPASSQLVWPWAEEQPNPREPASFDARVGGLLEAAVVDWLAQGALEIVREQLTGPPFARR